MVFPTIMPANSVSGFNITNSVRFNKADNPQLNLANVGTVTNDKKFTYSVWLKRSQIGSANYSILSAVSGNNKAQVLFRGGSNNAIRFIETPDAFSSTDSILTTAAAFRDASAWYNIVIAYDSTDGTAANRVKIYANGVLQTLSGTTVNENYTTPFNEASYNLDVGHFDGASGEVYDGYMSEANFIDGQQLAPTAFGETDDNGVWIPIKYTGTYGNNGFFLEFKQTGTGTNASGIGADTSGNGRHFAPTNLTATDIGTDSPTNNFCTLNSLDIDSTAPTLAEGNLDYHSVADTQFNPVRSTFAVTQGKWYAEWKYINTAGFLGVITTQSPLTGNIASDSNVRSIFRIPAGLYGGRNNSGGFTDVGDNSQTFSDNDIGQVALDMDNGYVYFGINGTYLKGQDGSTTGNPAGNNGSAGGAANHPTQLLTDQHDGTIALVAGDFVSGTTGQIQCNFGGGAPFAISSGNADAKGHGNFEFAVPSGFFALCSKNLAEFG